MWAGKQGMKGSMEELCANEVTHTTHTHTPRTHTPCTHTHHAHAHNTPRTHTPRTHTQHTHTTHTHNTHTTRTHTLWCSPLQKVKGVILSDITEWGKKEGLQSFEQVSLD